MRVRANAFVSELIAKEILEARVPARLAAAFAAWVEDELGRVPSGDELEEWFEEHDDLCDLFAGGDELERFAERHFGSAFADAPAVEAQYPELERAIAEQPDAVEPFLVYSDWLQEHGDPLGELIALGADAGRRPAFERLLERRKSALLGELAPHVPSQLELEWFCGLVREVRADVELPGRLWEPLWGLRVTRVARVLHVDMVSTNRYAHDAMMKAFVEHAPATVDRVVLDQVQGVDVGKLMRPGLRRLEVIERPGAGARARLPPQLPASLDTLLLHVGIPQLAPGAARWPVRVLGLNATVEASEVLRTVDLPALERLELQPPPVLPLPPVANSGANWGPESGIEAVLDALDPPPPALHELSLHGELGGLTTLAMVGSRALAERIDELALSSIGVGDRDLTAVVERLVPLKALRSLDVTGNELTSWGLQRLRDHVSTVIDRGQLPVGTLADRRMRRFAGSRLVPGRELVESRRWQDSGREDHFAWARYQGTEDYELWVRDDLANWGCTCPSSYQPCKHVVALALLAEARRVPTGHSPGVVTRVGSARAAQSGGAAS